MVEQIAGRRPADRSARGGGGAAAPPCPRVTTAVGRVAAGERELEAELGEPVARGMSESRRRRPVGPSGVRKAGSIAVGQLIGCHLRRPDPGQRRRARLAQLPPAGPAAVGSTRLEDRMHRGAELGARSAARASATADRAASRIVGGQPPARIAVRGSPEPTRRPPCLSSGSLPDGWRWCSSAPCTAAVRRRVGRAAPLQIQLAIEGAYARAPAGGSAIGRQSRQRTGEAHLLDAECPDQARAW